MHRLPFSEQEVEGLANVLDDEVKRRLCLEFALDADRLLALARGGGGTVQQWLTELQAGARMKHLKEVVYANDKVALTWLVSLQCMEAGKWLDAVPKYAGFIMGNLEYRAALRYRMQLPAERSIPGLRCMCQLGQRNGQNVHACVDVVGHHLASGCPIGGHRIATHNGVVHALDSVLHYVGLWTKREELHAFDNFETGEERGLRPDITVFNMPGQTGKLCLDVTVTSPLLGTQKGQVSAPTTMAKVMEVGRAANGAFKGKMTKYSTYAANNGFGFAPIVFESTGLVCTRRL